MWGIFIGIALGVLQMLVLRTALTKMISSSETWVKLVMAMVIIAKIVLIVFILYLMFTLSIAHLVWAAGGMLIGLITASILIIKRQGKTD